MIARDMVKEAWSRYADMNRDVETGEPVDDYGYPQSQREAFIEGVKWAAAHAEAGESNG